MLSHTHSHVTVMVSDMERSIAFYTETLGLELRTRYGNHYAEIDCKGLTIGLHPTAASYVTGTNYSIGLGVDDFDGAVAELKSHNVTVDVKKDGWGQLANFADPDGNAMYLVENQQH